MRGTEEDYGPASFALPMRFVRSATLRALMSLRPTLAARAFAAPTFLVSSMATMTSLRSSEVLTGCFEPDLGVKKKVCSGVAGAVAGARERVARRDSRVERSIARYWGRANWRLARRDEEEKLR